MTGDREPLSRSLKPVTGTGTALFLSDAEAPLFTDTAVKLEVGVGDVRRIAEDYARALPAVPVIRPGARVKRGSRRGYEPKGRKF
jgi:hypothetical protein